MKNGLSRFEFYLQKIELLMQLATKEQNPALFLYKNDARTLLFMLEALSRLYGNLHNKKKFFDIEEHFKLLEDGIGVIDYYDYYTKIFLAHPTVPVHIREYMEGQTREKIQHLNDLLSINGWLGEDAVRINKLRKKLDKADWLHPKEEVKGISEFYEDEIKQIKKFVKANRGQFTEMESQVHELRRNIRWLSIYPQALQGMIQMNDCGITEKLSEKYLKPEIVNSKYNIMPDTGINTWFILFEKNYFLALSWLIAETGRLKDEGLQNYVVMEALQQTENLDRKDAYKKSFEILGIPTNTIDKILSDALEITNRFIMEGNFDNLIAGLAHTKKAKEV